MTNFKQPDTVINFYAGVPITDGLQVAFQSREQQSAWWNQYRDQQHTALTHIRYTNGYVRIEGEPRDMMSCNYLSFNNVAFEGTPFYGKITSVVYLNPNTVQVNFEIDYWQTFMHDANYRASSIDREHLTQAQHDRAVANPAVEDIRELYTEEDLPVGSDLEVRYAEAFTQDSRPDKISVKQDGLLAWAPRAAGENSPIIHGVGGYAGLVSTVGDGGGYEDPYSDGSTRRRMSLVLQIAKYEGIEDMIAEVFNAPIDGDVSAVDVGYSDGFARGYVLLSLGAGVDMGGDHTLQRLFVGDEILEDRYGRSSGEWGEFFTRFTDYMTGNNITHQILGVWMVPSDVLKHNIGHRAIRFSVGQEGPKLQTHQIRQYEDISGYDVQVRNPKLRRAPFRYIRATSPSGTTKDFYIERFHHNIPDDGGTHQTPRFMYYGNFDDVPSLSLVPVGYNGHSIDFNNRLTYNSFPQVGFNIDGFLSHISTVQQNAILGEASHTQQAREAQTDRMNRLNGGLSATDIYRNQDTIAKTVGGAVEMFTTGRSAIETSAGQEDAARLWQGRRYDDQANNGVDDFAGIRSGDTPSADFGHQRGALIGSGEYVAGNAEGSLTLRLGRALFTLQTVTLQPELIRQYDDFLDIYGYKSGRVGIPRIASWTKGGVLPRFVNFDGLRFTYVKTNGLKVHSIFEPAAQYIQQLFDGGCRFIDGSVLDA